MNKKFSELCETQRDFDKNHVVSSKGFYIDIDEKNLQELEHLVVCLIGEIGEFSNVLKKVTRGDISLAEVKSHLDEELADVFIYILKIANQFNVDLEKEFFKKVRKNQSRFRKS